jgi:hypothetical protein
MTGEEHYAAAERLVDAGFHSAHSACMSPESRSRYLAAAQVHATLALAAGLLAAAEAEEAQPAGRPSTVSPRGGLTTGVSNPAQRITERGLPE